MGRAGGNGSGGAAARSGGAKQMKITELEEQTSKLLLDARSSIDKARARVRGRKRRRNGGKSLRNSKGQGSTKKKVAEDEELLLSDVESIESPDEDLLLEDLRQYIQTAEGEADEKAQAIATSEVQPDLVDLIREETDEAAAVQDVLNLDQDFWAKGKPEKNLPKSNAKRTKKKRLRKKRRNPAATQGSRRSAQDATQEEQAAEEVETLGPTSGEDHQAHEEEAPDEQRHQLEQDALDISEPTRDGATGVDMHKNQLKAAAQEEQSMRHLEFGAEQDRVKQALDDFVPDVDVSVAEYEEHRARVEQAKIERRLLEEEAEAARNAHEERLRERVRSEAAILVQKSCRGFLGRKRARAVAAHGGLAPFTAATAPCESNTAKPGSDEAAEAWKTVHDPHTGDTWYYNPVLGVSQWEIPEELGRGRKVDEAPEQPDLVTPLTTPMQATSTRADVVPTAESSGDWSEFRPMTGVSGPRPSTSLSGARSATPGFAMRPGVFTRGSLTSDVSVESEALPPMTPQGSALPPNASSGATGEKHDDIEAHGRSEFPVCDEEDDLAYFVEDQAINKSSKHRDGDDGGTFAQTKGLEEQEGSSSDSMGESSASDEEEEDEYALESFDPSNLFAGGNQATETRPPSVDEASRAETESTCSSGVWNQDCETPRFFLPDGSTNIQLRETVRNALKQTKFDSVSSLMATMGQEAKAAKKAARRARRQEREKNQVFDMKAVVECANLNQGAVSKSLPPAKKRGGRRRRVPGKARLSKAQKSRRAGNNKHSNNNNNNHDETADNSGEEYRADTIDEMEEEHGDEPPALHDIPYANAQDLQSVEGDVQELERMIKPQEMCFLCWSAGDDMVKHCDQHQKEGEAGDKEGRGSVLTCANWNVAALQRKYRSEQIQELFAKAQSSLRWDLNRKRFVTVVQAKHPTYRAVYDVLEGYNRTLRSKIKTMKWFKSVLDLIRVGRIKGEQAARKCSLLRAKETLENNRWIRKFKETVVLLEPQGQVTGDDVLLAGKVDLEAGYKVMHREDSGPCKRVAKVMAPTAKPRALYARRPITDIPPPRHGRVPAPSFVFTAEADNKLVRAAKKGETEELLATLKGTAVNTFMDVNLLGSWVERLASHTARTSCEKAVKEIRDQIPQVAKLRTKHPPPTSTKFATFLRKELSPEEARRENGFPPMMAMLSLEVTTAISAQYGKFVVTSKSSIAPVKKKYPEFHDEDNFLDESKTFSSLHLSDSASLGCTYDPVVSKLNLRFPPTITASATVSETLLAKKREQLHQQEQELFKALKAGDLAQQAFDSAMDQLHKSYAVAPLGDESLRHYQGENREIQTGESDDVGFRTTMAPETQQITSSFETTDFVPSSDIAVPNTPGIRGALTTKAGVEYPFCIPSTRELTLLDHFHLLAFPEAQPNSTCCFTTLGRQDPGLYLMRNDDKAELGILEMRVYRSFAYFQLPHIEEFQTAEGISYWYNRKTGQTFWESPLVDLSSVAKAENIDQDRPLEEDPLKPLTKSEQKKFSETLGPKRKPPSQLRMRQHLLVDYEDVDLEATKQDASGSGGQPGEEDTEYARELAKAEAKRKAQDKRYRERVGQVQILKGTSPLLSLEEEKRAKEQAKLKKQRKQQRKRAKAAKRQAKAAKAKNTKISEEDEPTPMDDQELDAFASAMPESAAAASAKAPRRRLERSKSYDKDGEHTTLILSIQSALQNVMKEAPAGSQTMSSDKLLKTRVGLGLGIGLGKKGNAEDRIEPAIGDSDSETLSEISSVSDDSSSTFSESSSTCSESSEVLVSATPRHRGPGGANGARRGIEPTPTPDEKTGAVDIGDDASSENSSQGGELAEHATHEPAGEGRYWTATGTAQAKAKGKIIKSSAALPEGFVNSVYKPHTAKQHADYLPALPNLNEARSVGVVKPRQILKDWSYAGFDPWSDGKDQYTTSFVPSLFVDEGTGQDQSGGAFGDKEGMEQQRQQVSDQARLAEELEQLFSWCRHGKYDEIDDFFSDPDCIFPVDTKDSLGNTLLSIAAQNGNKRIAKLCLRHGADINTQNLNGQTVLHYCLSYGFDSLSEYFMQKGADDSLLNADGLTCYEGLSLESVENM
ncbi:Acyl-CoA-binding domain-containing protein 6 [Durusdinium trenchii]|uniref:Acyl-CoA-binding domain-containing protein 6 n=1 Tax=Durusdinium trenchii TaxID=1381693 RepID=A0ABP0ISR7_9DINO